jgi:Ca2+-binding EF-hand superfamily protein
LDRLGFSCPKYEKLPLDIEHALADIFAKELALNQNLEIIKNKLRQKYDYSTQSVFKAIDGRNQNYIGMYSLAEFLGKAGFRATERESVAILRRLDVEGNGKITFANLAEFLADGQETFKD